jgi:hypothetical protein
MLSAMSVFVVKQDRGISPGTCGLSSDLTSKSSSMRLRRSTWRSPTAIRKRWVKAKPATRPCSVLPRSTLGSPRRPDPNNGGPECLLRPLLPELLRPASRKARAPLGVATPLLPGFEQDAMANPARLAQCFAERVSSIVTVQREWRPAAEICDQPPGRTRVVASGTAGHQRPWCNSATPP